MKRLKENLEGVLFGVGCVLVVILSGVWVHLLTSYHRGPQW